MARLGLVLGISGIAGLLVLARKRPVGAPAPVPFPSPVPAPIPASPSNVAAPPAKPKPKPHEPDPKPPAVTPAAPAASSPLPPPGDEAVSVPLPLGWRRLAPSELTPELVSVRDQVTAQGFDVGTFNPFDLDGQHYAVLVEQDSTGVVNVAMAVDATPATEPV